MRRAVLNFLLSLFAATALEQVKIAESLSTSDRKVSAMQGSAQLLEQAVESVVPTGK
jgi:hypothetical protein